MKVEKVTIGSDPELFIINEKTEKVVSSIGLIPGKKNDPWVGKDMPIGFGIETDNILAEFNIPPVTTCEDFINNIEYMKNYIRNFVKEINPDYGILCAASMIVDEDQLQSDEAKEFGCDPDYCCYTESENEKPQGERTNLRSAGFHIHVGYNDGGDEFTSLKLIKYMDQFIGLPSIVVDQDTRRRNLYGKAGAFRLQRHGLEYRTLSSAMMSTPESLKLVWDGTEKAIRAFNNEVELIDPNVVQDVINNSKIREAEQLIEQYGLLTY